MKMSLRFAVSAFSLALALPASVTIALPAVKSIGTTVNPASPAAQPTPAPPGLGSNDAVDRSTGVVRDR